MAASMRGKKGPRTTGARHGGMAAPMTVAEVIRAPVSLLDRRDRRLSSAAVLAQMTSSLLDLAGVALIGLVGALSVTTIAG